VICSRAPSHNPQWRLVQRRSLLRPADNCMPEVSRRWSLVIYLIILIEITVALATTANGRHLSSTLAILPKRSKFLRQLRYRRHGSSAPRGVFQPMLRIVPQHAVGFTIVAGHPAGPSTVCFNSVLQRTSDMGAMLSTVRMVGMYWRYPDTPPRRHNIKSFLSSRQTNSTLVIWASPLRP